MAYVESQYYDGNVDATKELVETTLHETMCAPSEHGVSSDYCGFVSEDLPPIYRQQLREAAKAKIVEEEASRMGTNVRTAMFSTKYVPTKPNETTMDSSIMDNNRYFAKPASKKNKENDQRKSSDYVWETSGEEAKSPAIQTNIYTRDYHTLDCMTMHDYVPGFSPPPYNDMIHRRSDIALPQAGMVEATMNLFNGHGHHEKAKKNQSIYVTGEEAETQMFSRHDSTLSSSDISIATAQLGPRYGERLSDNKESYYVNPNLN